MIMPFSTDSSISPFQTMSRNAFADAAIFNNDYEGRSNLIRATYKNINETSVAQDSTMNDYRIDPASIRNNMALKDVWSRYETVNLEEIAGFLAQNRFLIRILASVEWNIKKYFPKSNLSLEYTVDPEISGKEQLVINIENDLAVEDALMRYDLFEDDWCLGYLSDVQNKLVILL